MYPLQLTASDVDNMINNQDLVNSLFNTYYSSLVPVRYTRTSSDSIIVNKFELIFKIDINYG